MIFMKLIGYQMLQGMPAKLPITEGQCMGAAIFNKAFHQVITDLAHTAGADIHLFLFRGRSFVLAHW